jgi:serine/threonine protein kinase
MHRDIKLENILVTKNSVDEPRVVLTDLGLVCFGDHETTGLTTACGSIGYVAPEVFLGSYGTKADIFSAGCVLYTMLSGGMPFEGSNDLQLNKAGVVKFPMKHWKNVHPNAIEFVR